MLDCRARIEAEELGQGTWIVLLRADEIPHLVMLQAGVCHSLEHDGLHHYPASQLWRLIESRRIPSVLCRLAVEPERPVHPFFAAFDGLDGEIDCFVPVRDYCASWFPACAVCDYPYELMPLLASAGKLAKSGSRHLPGRGAGFVLPRYSRSEIRERIAEVRRRRDVAG